MNEAVQWILLAFLLVIQFLMLRRIGQLERARTYEIMPTIGPTVGEALPEFSFAPLLGDGLENGDLVGRRNLLLFLSENCPQCKTVLGSLSVSGAVGTNVDLIKIDLTGGKARLPTYLDAYNLPGEVVCVAEKSAVELGRLGIVATPSFILVGPDLIVEAAGLCDGEEWSRALSTTAIS